MKILIRREFLPSVPGASRVVRWIVFLFLSKLTFNSLCILCSFTHDDTFARVLPKNVGLFLFSPFNTFSCRNTNFFFYLAQYLYTRHTASLFNILCPLCSLPVLLSPYILCVHTASTQHCIQQNNYGRFH